MNNLYVIAIGGSGERILRSLTMVLAAGVDINASMVIPVIVDNDAQSKALTNCKDLIRAYRDPAKPGVHALYSEIAPLTPSFCKTEIAEPIVLDVSGGNIGDLKNVIGCPSSRGEEDPNNKAIKSLMTECELLFTDSELNMPLNYGFVGCPNIGSVVMNSMSLSDPQFNTVMTAAREDGVIVVGSLFGGTGAAGIPLIVNKLLHNEATTDKPRIGVVAMLPYFKIEPNDEDATHVLSGKYDVNSDIFDLKTRAALMYYDKHMSKKIDYMYYVGDDNQPSFKKSLGGPKQDNPATLCDVMAAMAIVDFSNNAPTSTTTYKRPVWGFTDDGGVLSNTSGVLNKNLKRALVKFSLMKQVFVHRELFPTVVHDDKKTHDYVKDINFDSQLLSSITTDSDNLGDAAGLNYIIKAFDTWLEELARGNSRTVRTGRTLKVFNGETTVDSDKLATAFYADSDIAGMGLAQWEHKGGFLGFGGAHDEPIRADILNNLQNAYRTMPDQYRKTPTAKQTLPIALYYISEALDKVLEKSFKI